MPFIIFVKLFYYILLFYLVLYSYLNLRFVAHNGVQFVMMVSRTRKLKSCAANWVTGIPLLSRKSAGTRTTDMQVAALFSTKLIVRATRFDYCIAITAVWDNQTALTPKTSALSAVIIHSLRSRWLSSMKLNGCFVLR